MAINVKNDGDVLYAADWTSVITTVESTVSGHTHNGVDSNRIYNEVAFTDYSTENTNITTPLIAVCAHSSTKMSIALGTKIYQWDGSSSTFTLKKTAAGTLGKIIKCKADPNRAIAIIAANNATAYVTTDGGDNWTDVTTGTGDVFYDASWPAATKLVAACGNHIHYSANDGAAWSESASIAGEVFLVDMYDASNGICLVRAGNSWTTTNGAVAWTDSTKATPITWTASSSKILCYGNSTFIWHGANFGATADGTYNKGVYTGTAASATATLRKEMPFFYSSLYEVAGVLKSADGNYYVFYRAGAGAGTTLPMPLIAAKSSDGTTWTSKICEGITTYGGAVSYGAMVDEITANQFIVATSNRRLTKITRFTMN